MIVAEALLVLVNKQTPKEKRQWKRENLMHGDDEKDEDYEIPDEDLFEFDEKLSLRKRDKKGQMKKNEGKPKGKELRLMQTAQAFRLKHPAVNNETTRLFFEDHKKEEK